MVRFSVTETRQIPLTKWAVIVLANANMWLLFLDEHLIPLGFAFAYAGSVSLLRGFARDTLNCSVVGALSDLLA